MRWTVDLVGVWFAAEETSKILSLHHAERWPVGTIGAPLGRHHDTGERVLAQSGLEVHRVSVIALFEGRSSGMFEGRDAS